VPGRRRYTPAMPRPGGSSTPDESPADLRAPAAVAVLATPVGPLHAAACDEGIVGLELRTTVHLAALERELGEHFAGTRDSFDLPVIPEGVSDWDRRVLDGVRGIPRGSTASYGEVARRIGKPGAARAVGGAVGRNPIGLLIPCHRVVAGDGTLGGYGGSWFGSREELLGLKERLLELEGVVPPPRSGARR
jgi:O-6-methylguanine DNA methyltransferase